ncbi:MAG: hypothetical protein ICV85_03975 [Tolypothrix sp. T3-bin4]|nr:hypothetical protein [Tolypothrix sp. Co-bin9]MBD0301351.1 hypothetical protein [Tolypothrix sp. T3-bin4]
MQYDCYSIQCDCHSIQCDCFPIQCDCFPIQCDCFPIQEANTLQSIASIHLKSGEFQQALDILNQALEISKQKQNSGLQGLILFYISNVYGDLGAYELSIEKSKEILAIYQKSNPSLGGN